MLHDCTKEGTCTILHQSVPNIEGFHFLSLIDDTFCVRLAFNALVWGLSSAVWLLACSHMNDSSGSIQKGLTFVRRMCWLSWHFNLWYFKMSYCRRRGNVNLDGVASSKRSLFWMVAVIAAACSVLHERAAFVSALGRFARTLLQLCFHFAWSQSVIFRKKCKGWKLQVPWLVGWCWVCSFRFA